MGRRRPYILFGGLGLAVTIALFWMPKAALFWITAPGHRQIFVYYLVFYVLYYLTRSVSEVPYAALGVELSRDYEERTSITAIRYLVGVPAIPLATLTYWVATNPNIFSNEKTGMAVCGVAMGVIIATMALATFFGARERIRIERQASLPLREALRLAVANRPFLFLALSGFFFSAGQFYSLQFANCLVIYGVFGGDKHAFATLYSQSTIFSLGVGVLTSLAVKHFAAADKKNVLVWCAVLMLAVPLLSLAAFSPSAPRLYFFYAAGLAAAWAYFEVLPLSILADLCDIDELTTRHRREGALTGIYGGVYQAGLTLAPVVSMISLQIAHFDASSAQQSAATVSVFRYCLVGFGALFFLLSLLFASLVRIRRQDVLAAQVTLAGRSNA